MRPLLSALLAAALALAPFATAHAGDDTAPGPLEAVSTTTIEADIDVDAQGALTGLAILTTLPEPLRANLDKRIRQWTFRPASIDGVAQPARGRLLVNLSATKHGEGVVIHVDHASVRDVATAAGPLPVEPAPVESKDVTPPRFPSSVLRRAEMPARVLVAVHVDEGGRVVDASIVRTALLDVDVTGRSSPEIVREFEKAALQGARKWTFAVLPGAAAPTPENRTVFVPVGFGQTMHPDQKPGAWRKEVRTARRAPAWLQGLAPLSGTDIDPMRAITPPGALAPLQDVAGTAL